MPMFVILLAQSDHVISDYFFALEPSKTAAETTNRSTVRSDLVDRRRWKVVLASQCHRSH